jgi:hypothetical protein
MPGLRSLGVVGSSPTEEQIRTDVSAAIDSIVASLIKPISTQESVPTTTAEAPARQAFTGTLDEVNRFFYQRGWTDGLPIIPPTEEAVAEMLTGTDLPRDRVVTHLIPRLGKATVEKIAINAVMAGALPTYMPILITAVQALMEPRAHFGTYEVSTGSWAPCLLMNGPIVSDLQIKNGSGAMSPGSIANAAIGRALALIIRNIGGVRTGVEDMGVMGNPMKYSMVLAENEAESPWEPLHVEQGCRKEDSALTVFFPNSLSQMLSYGSTADGIVRGLAYNISPGRRGLTCILLTPTHAQTLARNGWTKQDITRFVSEYARAPLSHHPEWWSGADNGEEPVEMPGIGRQDKLRMRSLKDSPEESMSVLRSPEWLRVLVVGGPGAFTAMIGAGKTTGYDRWVTRQIELPSNWSDLVKKYRGVTPTYQRY